MVHDKYERGLEKCPANYTALTPLYFLQRAAEIYPGKTAIIYGDKQYDYRTYYDRCRKMASALKRRGIGKDDTVAMLAPNVPAVLEAYFGVPMCGAILNAMNTRLDAEVIAFQLQHGEARMFIVDQHFRTLAQDITERLPDAHKPILVEIAEGMPFTGAIDYEDFLNEGDAEEAWQTPEDEWQAITLNYTSGTTGNPKGVVCHHRGAYLEALGNVIAFGLNDHSVYLWTLPMFHCNGWTYPWAVAAVGGTHICLSQVDPAEIFTSIVQHDVTHFCGAPVILNMLIHAPEEAKRSFPQIVNVATGGAAPPSTVIERMQAMGFRITHIYGLTETYGPSTYCARQAEWDNLDMTVLAGKLARQGVRFSTLEDIRVFNPETMEEVPSDGETIGEVMFRGNTVMKGYLKNETATRASFADGWFHSGDLGVRHPDSYIEIKDRSKDIIISGGENISSLEIEEVLYRHPAVREAAVVAGPDEKWGETPCAFVDLSAEADDITEQDLITYCRAHMAHFKAPKKVIFGELPKTATGKIQKYLLREWAKEA
ncbi:MAG TPA: acyl-CoA synthetase [Candidatus Latescibacteria bacterium]|nr:acyl-CoA synthetase [Candidatus Latescibacterota bacterium]